MLGALLVHVSNYSIGNLLVTVASFVSFPIFTRVFEVGEYGILSLISSLLLFICGLGKLGVQHAIPRFYAEVRHGNSSYSLRTFYSTALIGMAAAGLVATALWLAIGEFAPAGWISDERVRAMIVLTAPLVVVRIVESGLTNILRAQQRSALLSAYTVVRRYLVMVSVLLAILWLMPGLKGLYTATVLAECVAVAALGVILLRQDPVSVRDYSPELHRALLAFGLPMIGFELGGVVLNVGDRYMLQAMMNTEAVGIYSAAYNVCEYVQFIVIAAVGQALVPAYTRLWEEKGEAETSRFIEQVLHFYLLMAAAVLAGLTAVGPEVLSLLASEKYLAGSAVIPWVMAGLLISGSAMMLGAGIYIHKQTVVMMTGIVLAAVLNLGLNAMLIPRAGILGAAMATLVSEVFLALLAFVYGRRRLRVAFPAWQLIKFAALAAIMYLVVTQINMESLVAELVTRIVVGALTYTALLVLFDGRSRTLAGQALSRVFPRARWE